MLVLRKLQESQRLAWLPSLVCKHLELPPDLIMVWHRPLECNPGYWSAHEPSLLEEGDFVSDLPVFAHGDRVFWQSETSLVLNEVYFGYSEAAIAELALLVLWDTCTAMMLRR